MMANRFTCQMLDRRTLYVFDQNALTTDGHWYYDIIDDTVNANGRENEAPSVKLTPDAASSVHATVVELLNL